MRRFVLVWSVAVVAFLMASGAAWASIATLAPLKNYPAGDDAHTARAADLDSPAESQRKDSAISAISASTDYAGAVTTQPDGKIVAAGASLSDVSRSNVTNARQEDFALARYDADGSLDQEFGRQGRVTTDFKNSSLDEAYDVAIQPDGKIVAAGGYTASGMVLIEGFALARYEADGTLDKGFGDGGKVVSVFEGHGGASSLVLQPDGRILVAGSLLGTDGEGSAFALARYETDGTLDKGFGDGGLVITQFDSSFGGNGSGADGVALRPDGKILVAGVTVTPDGTDGFALARYEADGTLDTSFDGDGKVITNFGAGSEDEALDVAALPGGKTVVGGGAASDNLDMALARYNANGSLDDSFGGDGKVTTDFGNSEELRNLEVQDDGKILAGGATSSFSDSSDFVLARYDTDGTLDETFGNDDGDGGWTPTDFYGAPDAGIGLSLHPDGGAVGVGVSLVSGSEDFALTRYGADGELDTDFSANGWVTTNFDISGVPEDIVRCEPGKRCSGTNQPNNIRGTEERNSIFARGGPDRALGRSGNDTVRGQSGDDRLSGGDGNDVVLGGDGNDIQVSGGTGGDELSGGTGNDTLTANDGEADRLFCGEGTDTAVYDAGLDTVVACENVNPQSP